MRCAEYAVVGLQLQRHLRARGFVPPKTQKKAELVEALQRFAEAEQDRAVPEATEGAATEGSSVAEQLQPAPDGDAAAHDDLETPSGSPDLPNDGPPTLKHLMRKSRAMLQEVRGSFRALP